MIDWICNLTYTSVIVSRVPENEEKFIKKTKKAQHELNSTFNQVLATPQGRSIQPLSTMCPCKLHTSYPSKFNEKC